MNDVRLAMPWWYVIIIVIIPIIVIIILQQQSWCKKCRSGICKNHGKHYLLQKTPCGGYY